MSDLAIGGGESGSVGEGAFRPRTVALMAAIGILGFLAMLVLGAYAPDLRSGNGGGHALSKSAVGFSGIVRLVNETGSRALIVRDERAMQSEDLMVLTPQDGTTDMDVALEPRAARATLVVLPKWQTVADPDHSGWVRYESLHSRYVPEGVLAPRDKLGVRRVHSGGRPLLTSPDLPATIRFVAPRPLQTISGAELRPLVTDAAGRVVVGQLRGKPLYVLADPDLLSNVGMRNPCQAASALALLEWMNSTGAETIGFDVTLAGLGRKPSLLKLAFDPPFLGMTLALAIAAGFAGVHALGRFGAPRRRARAIAFGRAALVDNAAALVRMAGREAALGGRYAAVVRERAALAFGVPARLRDAALDAYLDRLGHGARFSALARDAEAAGDAPALVAAARALHDWQTGVKA